MVVQELIAKLGFQVDQSQMDKADTGMNSLMAKGLKFVGALYLAQKAFQGMMAAISIGSEFEDLTTGFKVLLGDLGAAKILMQQINEYANVSPFETAGVAQGVKLLMAANLSANDSLAITKKLGDIALGDQTKLSRLTLVMSQVKSMGKLQGQDLMQMAQGAAFNPLKFLAEKRGVSVASLKVLSEKGKISFEDTVEAINYAVSKGQMFYNGAAEGAKTLSGLWSTLKDNLVLGINELAGEGTPFYTFIKNIVTELIKLSPMILDAYRQLGAFLGLMLSDGPTAADTAAGIATAFMTIADAIMGIGAAFQFIMVAVDVFQVGIAQMVGVIVDIVMMIPKAIADAVKGLVGLASIAASIIPGGKPGQWANTTAKLEAFTQGGYGEYTTNATVNGSEAIAKRWDKFRTLSDMIGGNKAAPPALAPTADQLSKLSGKEKPVVNVNSNVTIHAEGSMKDILTEQANNLFGLTVLSTRIVAASV